MSNGGIMGTLAALAMGHVRDIAGMGSALLGFSQFALGAVVSPLVGLGGEESAVAPGVGDGVVVHARWGREPAATRHPT